MVTNMSYHMIRNHPGNVCKTSPILLRFTLSVPDPIGKERFVLLIKLNEHCLLRATAYWAAGSMISSIVCNKICMALPRTCHWDAGAKPVVAIQLVIKPTGYKPAKVLAHNDENFQAGVGWGGGMGTPYKPISTARLCADVPSWTTGHWRWYISDTFPCAIFSIVCILSFDSDSDAPHKVLVVTSSHIPQRFRNICIPTIMR